MSMYVSYEHPIYGDISYRVICSFFLIFYFLVNADPCMPNPCHNGGTCIPTTDTFVCKCKDGWFGRFCEETTLQTRKCCKIVSK